MRQLVLGSTGIINSDFRSRLNIAKARVDQLESYRIKRLLNNSSEDFKYVFSLIPVLIHYNSPSLIAFVENAPCGVYDFQLNDIQKNYLDKLVDIDLCTTEQYQFDALYVMGSLGSVTQNALSDIDLWLCYSKKFSVEQRQRLTEKLEKIQAWARSCGVDVHFYLMNPDEFRLGKYHNEVSLENSGSAQYYFLLDEFYRSAIRLAGKRVLWLHILEKESAYNRIIEKAVAENQLNLDEWIDFGDFSKLHLGEYFGASLWQLYKGIRNPYKSAIKILLLESYAETYPETDLISRQFKQILLSNETVNYHFDPYLAMLEKVTLYLEKRKEFKRLECLRYCFYVKAMDQQIDEWKCNELRQLALSWGWKAHDFELLDNKKYWKAKQAMQQQKMLVDHLLRSYRNLINFARKFHINPSIMPQDTDILMRHLYSVFEVFSGKVELINEKIAKDLSEEEVTFIEVSEKSSTKAGWYLVNHAPLSTYDSNRRYVKYHKSLNKLVAWAYFNGIVTVNTYLHIVSQTVSLNRLRQFITDLRLSFPLKAPKMLAEDLYHPNEIRHLIIAINLTQDPTKKLAVKQTLSQIDLFNLSSSKQGIIGSISLIYRNMWNEIVTKHFDGNDSILKALKLISNKIYRSSAPPESVNVFCYSSQLRTELQKFVMGLVNRCITVQTGVIVDKQPQTFKLAGRKWQFVFNQKVELQEIKSEKTWGNIRPEVSQIPPVIHHFASEGFLQFFFEDNLDSSFNVYVLDKQNNMEIYLNNLGQKEDKIKQIGSLHAQSDTNQTGDQFETFNYPQFYQLIQNDKDVLIVPFKSKQYRDYIQHLEI
ncbi:adenylate cyclase [Vespertiliibacter pulmonis]|uniref:Adenylate cyclase n=1 Tax=Vespertiliibacter pulmonis TaxID=1443036 RepID=A0A3N4VG86_9PAST|nr:class I adenylate cyclase [Vespertiliibacter pulmonis]QLB20959.1 adenylate cyclase [Vespertiliibacter pulmonis]RPE80733.1 adenylate cyclase class 1 [Vespertiliibacter pulmonis]